MVALSLVSHAPWDRHSFVGDAIRATGSRLLLVVPAAEPVAYATGAGLLPHLVALF